MGETEDDIGGRVRDDNTALVEAIAQGARGAYWDILHRLRRLL